MTFDFTLPSPVTFIFTMAWIGLFMYAGIWLRARIAFLRKYLIPACIVGGLLGTVANWLFLDRLGPLGVDPAIIQSVSFHVLPLFFSGLAFRVAANKNSVGRIFFGGIWLAATFVMIPSFLYALVCVVTMALNPVFGTDYLASYAIVLTKGFADGPGSALSLGIAWDTAKSGLDLASLGMTGGTIGFLLAYIICIPLANYYHKRSRLLPNHETTGEAERRGYYKPEDMSEDLGRQTTHNSNVDTLFVHVGLVFLNYGLALALCLGVAQLLANSPFKHYVGMVWTFVWLAPLITGIPLKKLLDKLGLEHLINQTLMSHICNFFIDVMVICCFFGMTLHTLKDYMPMIIMASILWPIFLFILTKCVVKFVNNFKDIRVIYTMGVLLGTAATGIFMARILDPASKSPIAFEQAIAPLFISMVGIPTAPIIHLEVLGGHSPWLVVGGMLGKALLALICLIVVTRLLNAAYTKSAPEFVE